MIETEKTHRVLQFNQSQWLKQYIEFNTKKEQKQKKNADKDGKAFYKLMSNAIYGKTMKNFINRIDGILVNNERDYLKCTSRPIYIKFDNNLVAICKSKLALELNKPVYIGMFILKLS